MLIKRICESLQKPVFEVMEWPYSELHWWAAFFHINDHGVEELEPKPKKGNNADISVADSIAQFKKVASI